MENVFLDLKGIQLSPQGEYVKDQMINFFLTMNNAGKINHNKAISKLGTYRSYLSIEEFRRIFLIIQGEHVLQAIMETGSYASLFPTPFTLMMDQNSDDFIKSHVISMDFDSLRLLDKKLKFLNLSCKSFTCLPQDKLIQYAHTDEWKTIISYLLDGTPFIPSTSISLAPICHHEIKTNADSTLIPNNRLASNLLGIPNNWLSVAFVLCSTIVPRPRCDNKQKLVVNVFSRNAELEGNAVNLGSELFANFLCIFSLYQNGEAPIDAFQQLDLEIRMTKSSSFAYANWRHVNKDVGMESESRLNRIYVLKRSLNQKLLPLGVEIRISSKGLWSLYLKRTYTVIDIDISCTRYELKLDECFVENNPRANPKDIAIWNFVSSRYRCYFNYRSLAFSLGRTRTESEFMTASDISKILNYFSKKVLTNMELLLVSDRKGHYCLVDDNCEP